MALAQVPGEPADERLADVLGRMAARERAAGRRAGQGRILRAARVCEQVCPQRGQRGRQRQQHQGVPGGRHRQHTGPLQQRQVAWVLWTAAWGVQRGLPAGEHPGQCAGRPNLPILFFSSKSTPCSSPLCLAMSCQSHGCQVACHAHASLMMALHACMHAAPAASALQPVS